MTDPTARPAPGPVPGSRRAAISARVPSLPTVLASAACFLVMFEFLAFQLRAGRDPALGDNGRRRCAPTAARPRPVVIHRRIVVRRVVESTPAVSSVAGRERHGRLDRRRSSSRRRPGRPGARPHRHPPPPRRRPSS